MPTHRRDLVLVANPHSGTAHKKLDRAHRAIEQHGLRVVETVSLRDLERLRHWTQGPAEERPIVVAGGGDGTVGTVAGYVINTATPLGVLPMGTSNDVARSLGISMRIDEAVRVLAEGTVRRIDVGRLVPVGQEPRYFVHAAAMGIDVAFARLATRPKFRKRFGPLKYAAAAILATRRAEPFECELRVEGRATRLRLLHLSVINAPVFGGVLNVRVPGSDVDDRRLDVLAVEFMPYPQLLWHLAALLLRRSWRITGVRLYHLPKMHIHTMRPTDVSLDGEISGSIPGDFDLVAESLHVIMPAGSQS